ncbi:hypothetical protein PsorP6_003599 [Peronosclerospora sorghi]|uniref:Uncharacterized protein n=1 Tax=Peronosclerospora sorghi TaxID=230839 RepID=A0ACC0VQ24_9STRA|nr:hypothetical protein PsorP6_003599 [Peronosclerospora sorghi]
MPKKGLKTPFQRGHEGQFGLVVTERDEATSAVRAVTCQFCLKFGREAKLRAKRKRTSNAQSFSAPFRVDVYTRHHENAHPEIWAKFQQLSTDEKSNYFENAINNASTLLAHFDSHGALTLTFNRDIVEKVIGDVLFGLDDDSIYFTRARDLYVFKLHEDALPEDNADVHSVKIDSVLRHQESDFTELCGVLSDICLVKGPLSEEDIAEADLAVPHVPREEYMVAYADALIFIRDQGLFVIDSLETLPEPDVANIVNSIANLFAGLYSGIKVVLAVRGSGILALRRHYRQSCLIL